MLSDRLVGASRMPFRVLTTDAPDTPGTRRQFARVSVVEGRSGKAVDRVPCGEPRNARPDARCRPELLRDIDTPPASSPRPVGLAYPYTPGVARKQNDGIDVGIVAAYLSGLGAVRVVGAR